MWSEGVAWCDGEGCVFSRRWIFVAWLASCGRLGETSRATGSDRAVGHVSGWLGQKYGRLSKLDISQPKVAD